MPMEYHVLSQYGRPCYGKLSRADKREYRRGYECYVCHRLIPIGQQYIRVNAFLVGRLCMECLPEREVP